MQRLRRLEDSYKPSAAALDLERADCLRGYHSENGLQHNCGKDVLESNTITTRLDFSSVKDRMLEP